MTAPAAVEDERDNDEDEAPPLDTVEWVDVDRMTRSATVDEEKAAPPEEDE